MAARTMVVSFAELRDPGLARWIERNVAFPSSMVDRITPETTPEERDRVARSFGVDDRWPVITEPFSQWVIEEVMADPAYAAYISALVDEVIPLLQSAVAAGIATVGNLTFVGVPERETRRRALAGAGAIMIITSWAQLAAHLLDGATADPPPQDQLQRST